MKKILLLILLFPFSVFAYSKYVYAPAFNVGIELKSNGVMIAGTYKIGDISPAMEAGLEVGDMIISINDNKVSSVKEMMNYINVSDIKIGYIRSNIKNYTNLKLVKDNDTFKTGLYVKDSISGIGTLTYIDPETKIFGALGHEVGETFNISNGNIYSSYVTAIEPSSNGFAGEKHAKYNKDEILGNIDKNTIKGIFGKYVDNLSDMKLYEVAKPSKGKAKMLTIIEGNRVDAYDINIIKINKNDKTKNILFEITDDVLLSKTGGIIRGMSGSPIIQNDKIVGAVTHVILSSPHKGYGIFITNMLEEGEN